MKRSNDGRKGDVSRRKFLGAAATAAMAVPAVALSAEGTSAADDRALRVSPSKTARWDMTTDVVVVGSGAAAFAAAATARSVGSAVIMLEKAPFYGGTTAKSGGQFWIPNNSLLKSRGLQDPEEWALKLMARLSWPTLYDPTSKTLGLPSTEYGLIRTFYRRGPEAIDYLAKTGALKPYLAAHSLLTGQLKPEEQWPEYAPNLPENKLTYGRTLATSGAGAGMISQFQEHGEAAGVDLRLDHTVNRLFKNAKGQIVGVGVSTEGKQLAVRARKGVIFGSGGFTHNESMRRTYLRGFVYNGCALPTNTGDLIPMAAQAGADFGNMSNAWWLEQPLEVAITAPGASAEVWLQIGDSMFTVNRYGLRIGNEKSTYNERAQVHFPWDAVRHEYPNFLTYMIYDDDLAQSDPKRYPLSKYPIPPAGVNAPYVIKGATYAELAQNIASRLTKLAPHTGGATLDPNFAEQLAKTAERFNKMAADGKDLDFGRGDSASEAFLTGDQRPGNNKNPTMFPLSSKGPYYCVILVAGTLDTKGGPKIDNDARILGTDGAPIEGLYGAGNCIASPAAQAYWSGGATLGLAMVFGYLAGMHASASAEKLA